MTQMPERGDVEAAASRLKGKVMRTPMISSRLLNERIGVQVFLKCENMQFAGAFKFRGATNVIAQLTPEERSRGVITHSSGNHAQALALAAKRAGIRATIIMPEGCNPLKLEATEGHGANVLRCEATQESRESTCREEMERTGMILVHPYNDARIIAGAGTSARELLEERPDLDAIVTPVGGGGLLSGTAIAADGRCPVFGAEPAGADDAHRGFVSGERVTEQTPHTVCDGLRTCLGALNFEGIRARVEGMGVVSDDEALEMMRWVRFHTGQMIEPSSAVPLAAIANGSVDVAGKVGVIISGGNVDPALFD